MFSENEFTAFFKSGLLRSGCFYRNRVKTVCVNIQPYFLTNSFLNDLYLNMFERKSVSADAHITDKMISQHVW